MTDATFLIIISILFATTILFLIMWLNSRRLRKDLETTIVQEAEEAIKRLEDKYDAALSQYKMSNTNYEIFFKYLKDRLKNSRIRMKEVDRRGSFESDDEVGFIFKTIYDISADLAQFMENVNVTEVDESYLKSKINL